MRGAKRTYRRKKRVVRRRRARLTENTSYRFKRICKLDTITTSTTLAVAKAFTFSLSQLPSHSDFTALYDQYKLNAVSIKIIPRLTESTSSSLSVLHTCIDYDDAIAFSSYTDLMQKQSYRMTRGNKIFKCYFKPKMLVPTFLSTALTTFGTQPKSPTWIDCGYPEVPHYCLKTNFEPTSSVHTYDVYATYYCSFRGVR